MEAKAQGESSNTRTCRFADPGRTPEGAVVTARAHNTGHVMTAQRELTRSVEHRILSFQSSPWPSPLSFKWKPGDQGYCVRQLGAEKRSQLRVVLRWAGLGTADWGSANALYGRRRGRSKDDKTKGESSLLLDGGDRVDRLVDGFWR